MAAFKLSIYKQYVRFQRWGLTFYFTICCIPAFSQSLISGKIVNNRDGKPVTNASIGIPGKRFRQSDANGNFRFTLSEFKQRDSLIITSVGFKTVRIPVTEAVNMKEFRLQEQVKDLQPLVLTSYLNEGASGSKSETTGYFISWNTNHTGAEIGKIFYINQNEYKLERVRFKVNNQCDTCQIMLHIRAMVDYIPGDEILYDSITTTVKRLSFDDRFSEFDLRPYNLVFKQREIMVSLEVLHCTGSGKPGCSFCFIGTEEGEYYYKNSKKYDWLKSENDFSIYMRLIYRF